MADSGKTQSTTLVLIEVERSGGGECFPLRWKTVTSGEKGWGRETIKICVLQMVWMKLCGLESDILTWREVS